MRRPIATYVAGVLVLAGALVIVGVEASGAQPPPRHDTPVLYEAQSDPQLSDAELRDLTDYAQQEGVSVEVMIKRFGGQEPFTEAVAAIDEALPSGYVAAVWGDGSGVVTVLPGQEAVARKILDEYGAVASVSSANTITESDGEAIAERAGASLPQGLGTMVLAHVDPLGHVLSIEIVGPAPGAPQDAEDSRMAQVARLAADAGLRLEVSVRGGSGGAAARGGWNMPGASL